ncbi:MAG: ABC transporter ATP-binding protein [Candidatus Uhrbacteria bacterium]
MSYVLNNASSAQKSGLGALGRLSPFLAREKRDLSIAFASILVNSVATLVAPLIIGYAIDHFMRTGDFRGVLLSALALFCISLVALSASYTQTIRTGSVGRRVLYSLRNELFQKLQELPVAFFNQNKVGDLISRINSDTDLLSQFFARVLMQFTGNFFMIVGAGIFLLTLNVRLGVAALVPALIVLVITRLLSPLVKRKNLESLQTVGGMSAEIQESLANFKVIVAFNRMDYFRDSFNAANERNYRASIGAGLANNAFTPIYALASSLGQLVVLVYGISLIAGGSVTVGLLIGFLLYVSAFYTPLRQLATVWSTLQQSLAALDRISEVLALETDLRLLPIQQVPPPHREEGIGVVDEDATTSVPVLAFHAVSFRYPDGKDVLQNVNIVLAQGKTYALVGPTGGGKTTTASLMARLYDPSAGTVELSGRDIRSFESADRTRKIGFILQEPFLFSGTLLDNLFYGHPDFVDSSKDERRAALVASGLGDLLANFDQGLDTPIETSGETISLGQRQLVAFVRAVLRKPEILILDEATANIDTVTEQLLEKALEKLPPTTTKVIIAHRLNTIENADEIFFVNGGAVQPAGSFDHAVEMLMHGRRTS